MKWLKKFYLQSIPLRFGVCRFTGFLALLRNHCYSFHRTTWRVITSICRGPGPVATRMPFFSPKFKSAANFSAPAQEGNLFFLSGRSARKKIHNFPIKSSHLCRTSRHVWLSSSACDHCCAYQLICIIIIIIFLTFIYTAQIQLNSFQMRLTIKDLKIYRKKIKITTLYQKRLF